MENLNETNMVYNPLPCRILCDFMIEQNISELYWEKHHRFSFYSFSVIGRYDATQILTILLELFIQEINLLGIVSGGMSKRLMDNPNIRVHFFKHESSLCFELLTLRGQYLLDFSDTGHFESSSFRENIDY